MNTSAKALNAQEQKKSAPTNAWASGVNPITQRSTVTAPNGTAAPKTNISSKGLPASSKDTGVSQKMPASNIAFLAANMKGLNATLIHKNGDRYSGIFSTLTDKGYTIKMARKTSSSGKHPNGVTGDEVGEGDERSLTLATTDVVDLRVDGVRLDKSQGRAQNGTSSNFRTDTDISSGRAVRERDLQKWEGASDPKVDMSLSGGLDGWDQFAAHKQMTGKDSTYDENNYTTKLDTSAPGFKEKMAHAARIAREIETSSTNNAHQAEERGQINTRDDGIDEEAKYSGVQRNFQPLASGQPNRYTPPARRAPGGPPPPVNATTPDDPAIISSSRPESAAPNKAQVPTAIKPAEAATDASTPVSKEPSVTTASSTTEKTTMSIPAIKSFASTQASSTRVLPREGSATETVEKDVVTAFKHFSATEKLRIQDVHRLTARRDKAVKLNDLKKFAENFKLNTEVPSDLIPILTKDKDKQQAIMDRAKKNVGEIKATTPPRTTTSAPTDLKPAKPVVSRPESGVTSPQAPHDRQNQQRSRPNQPSFNPNSARNVQAHMQQQQQQQQMSGISARPSGPGNLGQRLQQNQNQRQHLANQHHQMPPQDPRMPPAGPASRVQSPTASSTKWNPTASFTPNPTIQPFQPSVNPSNGSSPVRNQAARPPPSSEKKPRQGNLFEGRTEGRKGPIPVSERISLKSFNPIPRLEKEVKDAVAKEAGRPVWADNGGIPPAFKTQPRWEVSKDMVGKGLDDVFVPARKPSISPPHSTMPQPPFQGQIGSFHQAQHGVPIQHGQTPQHTPRHQPAQLTHGGPGTPRYEDGHGHPMAFSRSNSSFQPPAQHMQQYAPFGNQGGQPNAFYPAQGFQPGGQPMSLRQGSQQGHQYYPQQPPSGHMMHVQPVGGQFPINPQMMYAAPGPVYQQHPGTGMPHQGPNGYGSPRGAPMMQTPSQQGHVQPVMFMHQGPAYASGAPMPQMRGGGNYAQIHQQPYSNSPGQFNPQPHRPTPSGSYAQPNMMPGAPPQGMVPNGAPIGSENVEDGK
ncbi:hypothetical protein E6O75_ATG08001 [Venturia nashicola]|uniref:LsmAD domain-containing protein n=1 Tax=Venturia nashicola TaxID=86259 RepID=A0A4Z1NLT1_9PEZI|nr:hypothetical protein E6O75_ATG08001 [Venturia nashicola]